MDYKTFLDFSLAMENKHAQQSIEYFWRLIDVNHNGRVIEDTYYAIKLPPSNLFLQDCALIS